MIIGRDFMRFIGINHFFSSDTIRWINRSVKMKPPHHYDLMMTDGTRTRIDKDYEDEEALCEAYAELFEATEILSRAYKKVSPSECAYEQDHMSVDERVKFQAILEKHKVLFDGELGLYPHKIFHLNIRKDAVPVHKKPYAVPYKRQENFRQELRNLVREGVLKPCGATKWASPTFIIPKPGSNTVRWVSDFRELNKVLKRPKYPVPRIQDIMLKQRGYSHFTKIDLSMMFYCFEHDESSKKLCTIITPFGKYQYQRLPMGIKTLPDFAQAMIKKILGDLNIEAYLDDLGIWTKGSFDEHLVAVEQVLARLAEAGMK